MSGDAENNDFSDGITEEILNALAQIADLKVAARTSAFQFKGQNVDLRRVGETLGGLLLEGECATHWRRRSHNSSAHRCNQRLSSLVFEI